MTGAVQKGGRRGAAPSLHNCCSQDGVAKLRCGHVLPIMSAACKDNKKSGMPVTEGMLGSQRVSFSRDSGCSGVVVRSNLVSPDEMTGATKLCILIDGTVRKVPTANIFIDTPYFVGRTEVLCISKPIYDVILGNVEGVRPPDDPDSE